MKLGMPKKYMGEDEGFIRLTTDEVRDNLVGAIARVMLDGDRIVLLQAGEEVAALIPIKEFNRLEEVMHYLKPSPFDPSEYEYYEDERGIHCLYFDDFAEEFSEILADVSENGELFAFLPPIDLDLEVDPFMPRAILIPINKFWISEYTLAAANNEI